MKRPSSEYLKTRFANSGRIAGHGMVEDNYNDECEPIYNYHQCTPVRIKEREKKIIYPVNIYYINVEEKTKWIN